MSSEKQKIGYCADYSERPEGERQRAATTLSAATVVTLDGRLAELVTG